MVQLRRCRGLKQGWLVRVSGRVRRPRPALHPLLGDRRARLARQGIYSELHAPFAQVLQRRQGPILLLRSQLAQRFRASAGEPLGPLLAAFLMGRAVVDLPDPLPAQFRAAGLSHALAASGFHLSVLLGLVMALVRRWSRRLQLPLSALAIALFVVLAGPQPSVLRAALMGGVVLVIHHSGAKARSVGVLLFTLVLLLLWQPAWILDLGFQFSAAATAGLLLTAPVLQRRLPSALAVPMAACLWTLPLQLWHFGLLPLYAVPLNLLAAPLLSLLITGAFAAGLVALLLPPLLPLLGWLMQWPAQLLLLLVAHGSALPLAQLVIGRPPILLLVMLSLGLLPWLLALGQHRRVGLLLVGLACFWQWQRLHSDALLQVQLGGSSLILLRHQGRGALVSSSASASSCRVATRLQQGLGLPRLDWLVLLDPVPSAAKGCWRSLAAMQQVLPEGIVESPGLQFKAADHGLRSAELLLGPQRWQLQRHSGSRLLAVLCPTTRTAPQKPVPSAGGRFSGARSGRRFGTRCATARSAVAMRPAVQGDARSANG